MFRHNHEDEPGFPSETQVKRGVRTVHGDKIAGREARTQ